MHRFRYLKYARSLVLIFIGLKIFWNQILGKLDPLISLSVTFTLLAGGVIFSMWKVKRDEAARAPAANPLFLQQLAAPAADASVQR